MRSTARRQAEGTLVYLLDQTDLYLRVHDGVRQVQLGGYIALPNDDGNEVAAVEPPPVVHYTPDHRHGGTGTTDDQQRPPETQPESRYPSQPEQHPDHQNPHHPDHQNPHQPDHRQHLQPEPEYPPQPDHRHPLKPDYHRPHHPDYRHPSQPDPNHPDHRHPSQPEGHHPDNRHPSQPEGHHPDHRHPSQPEGHHPDHRHPSQPEGHHPDSRQPSKPDPHHTDHRHPSLPEGHHPDHRHPSQPEGHHPDHRHPSQPEGHHPSHPDPRYPSQPDPRYPAPTDSRYPSFSDRLNAPDSRVALHPAQERPVYPDGRSPDGRSPDGRSPDGRFLVTPQRRPSSLEPFVPKHHHTSGPGLHLIALNSPQTGAMRGIRGADYQCFTQARAIGMKGTFRAFLSSKLQDLNSIVRRTDRGRLPIVNLKDEVLFDSWDAIFNKGKMKDATIYSFDGMDILTNAVWPEKMLWHGSTSGGQRKVESYCETWRLGDEGPRGEASPLGRGEGILREEPRSCSSSYVVLCVENSYVGQARR
ncbi:unnamed protein product [Boreogadus saida]